MELYKLYCILKRHTGFETMWRIQRELIMPEWYEERRKRARLALSGLTLLTLGIKTTLGDSDYFLDCL